MSSFSLTTSYNTKKVICNGVTIKQIWVKEGTKDKVQVYQAWKTEAYTVYTNQSQKGMNVTGSLTAQATKVFLSGYSNRGDSYVAYKFIFVVKINSIANSNAAYGKFYYYNPDGTLTGSYTAKATTSTGTKVNTTYNYKTVYGNYTDYDTKKYKGTLKYVLSVASSGTTKDGTTYSTTVSAPAVEKDSSYTASNTTGYLGGDCYIGYQTSSTAYRNVEDND